MERTENSQSSEEQRHAEEHLWLCLIAQGPPAANAAMKELVRRYVGDFRKRLRKWGFAGAEVDDAMQRVWIDVVAKAALYDPSKSPPKVWLNGFVNNELLRTWEIETATRKLFVSDGDERQAAAISRAESQLVVESPESGKAARELAECVQRAFGVFKRQRSNDAFWLYLRELEEWDIATIAMYRQSSEGATRQFLSNARRLLRPHLAPCLELRGD